MDGTEERPRRRRATRHRLIFPVVLLLLIGGAATGVGLGWSRVSLTLGYREVGHVLLQPAGAEPELFSVRTRRWGWFPGPARRVVKGSGSEFPAGEDARFRLTANDRGEGDGDPDSAYLVDLDAPSVGEAVFSGGGQRLAQTLPGGWTVRLER